MNHVGRLENLRSILGVDGSYLLVSNPLNVRWLTGFTGSNGQVLVSGGAAALITDSRYREQGSNEVPAEVEVVIASSAPGERVSDLLLERVDAPTIGFESDHLTVSAADEMQTALVDAGSKLALAPSAGQIAELRRIKDTDEVAALRRAGQIADDALAALLPNIVAGETELKLARLLEWEMAERGSERASFSTIMASGPNGAKPHARPSARTIEDGDLVVIDFGATVEGYGSDMTRTIVVGSAKPTAHQQRWYENVLQAQQHGVEVAQVGRELRSIHHETRSHLEASGQEGVYEHGTGHGVGLLIHENPILSARVEGVVVPSMALTVEPGAYVPGIGGVRVEDLVITSEAGPETITNFPKGLCPAL